MTHLPRRSRWRVSDGAEQRVAHPHSAELWVWDVLLSRKMCPCICYLIPLRNQFAEPEMSRTSGSVSTSL